MTAFRYTEIVCDGPGTPPNQLPLSDGRVVCGEAYSGQGIAERVRARARENGWGRRGNLDLCPGCRQLPAR